VSTRDAGRQWRHRRLLFVPLLQYAATEDALSVGREYRAIMGKQFRYCGMAMLEESPLHFRPYYSYLIFEM